MKIIHTADWHFNDRDHDEIKKCVEFIIEYAKNETPELFIVSGDITDSRYLNLDSKSARTILNIFNQMLDIAPVVVVTGTPSHCGFSETALRECRGKYPILVSDVPEQYGYVPAYQNCQFVKIEELGEINPRFIITQIPQPSKQFFINQLGIEDTDKAISSAMTSIMLAFGENSKKYTGVPHIANGHFQVGGAFISETQQLIGRDIEISTDQLSILNADIVCLGHIHKSQKIGDNIYYAGSPTRMNFGETEDKGFYVYHSDGYPQFIETPARYMHNAEFDLTDGDHEKQKEIGDILTSLAWNLQEKYEEYEIKLTFTVWQDEVNCLQTKLVRARFEDRGCTNVKLSIIRKPRETVRSEAVLNADTLPDKLNAMAELRGEYISESILNKAKALEDEESEPWIK